jgi:hypothetical protein
MVPPPRTDEGDVEAGEVGGRGVLDDDLAAVFHGSFLPADFAEAKYRISSTGKLRCSSSARMTWPT